NTCQPKPRWRHITAHDSRTTFLPRAVGADPRGGPGRSPCPRGACSGAGGRRPARGRDGPAVDRAVAARRAPLLAAAIERSAAGDHAPAPPPTQWPAARRATRPRGAAPGVGPGGRGGRRDPSPTRGGPRGQRLLQGAAPQPPRQPIPEIPAVSPIVTEY